MDAWIRFKRRVKRDEKKAENKITATSKTNVTERMFRCKDAISVPCWASF